MNLDDKYRHLEPMNYKEALIGSQECVGQRTSSSTSQPDASLGQSDVAVKQRKTAADRQQHNKQQKQKQMKNS